MTLSPTPASAPLRAPHRHSAQFQMSAAHGRDLAFGTRRPQAQCGSVADRWTVPTLTLRPTPFSLPVGGLQAGLRQWDILVEQVGPALPPASRAHPAACPGPHTGARAALREGCTVSLNLLSSSSLNRADSLASWRLPKGRLWSGLCVWASPGLSLLWAVSARGGWGWGGGAGSQPGLWAGPGGTFRDLRGPEERRKSHLPGDAGWCLPSSVVQGWSRGAAGGGGAQL